MLIVMVVAAVAALAVLLFLYRMVRSRKWQDAVDEAVSRGME